MMCADACAASAADTLPYLRIMGGCHRLQPAWCMMGMWPSMLWPSIHTGNSRSRLAAGGPPLGAVSIAAAGWVWLLQPSQLRAILWFPFTPSAALLPLDSAH